jgi:hypothetical protein
MKLTKTQKNYRKQINKAIKEGKVTDEYGDVQRKPIKWGKSNYNGDTESKARKIIPLILWLLFMYRLFLRLGGIEGITHLLQSLG